MGWYYDGADDRTKTIAIGKNGQVSVWCNGTAEDFHVINGGWRGSLRNGKIVFLHLKYGVKGFEEEDSGREAEVLWEGYVPRPYNNHYNSAIAWINEQIANGYTYTPEDMTSWETQFGELVKSLDTPEKKKEFLLNWERKREPDYDEDDQIPF